MEEAPALVPCSFEREATTFAFPVRVAYLATPLLVFNFKGGSKGESN